MKPEGEEVKSGFYVKTSEDNKTFEIVENFELTNEYKQHVCLPYFKDIHKVVDAVLSIELEQTVRSA